MDKERKLFTKGFIFGIIITFVVSLIVAAVFFGITAGNNIAAGNEWNFAPIIMFTDAFSISGFLGLLIYLITWVASKGAFDIFAYSIKLFWTNTFHKNTRETDLPRTYTEYKELKRGEEKGSSLYILFGSLPCLVAGIVLFIIYLAIY